MSCYNGCYNGCLDQHSSNSYVFGGLPPGFRRGRRGFAPPGGGGGNRFLSGESIHERGIHDSKGHVSGIMSSSPMFRGSINFEHSSGRTGNRPTSGRSDRDRKGSDRSSSTVGNGRPHGRRSGMDGPAGVGPTVGVGDRRRSTSWPIPLRTDGPVGVGVGVVLSL